MESNKTLKPAFSKSFQREGANAYSVEVQYMNWKSYFQIFGENCELIFYLFFNLIFL